MLVSGVGLCESMMIRERCIERASATPRQDHQGIREEGHGEGEVGKVTAFGESLN